GVPCTPPPRRAGGPCPSRRRVSFPGGSPAPRLLAELGAPAPAGAVSPSPAGAVAPSTLPRARPNPGGPRPPGERTSAGFGVASSQVVVDVVLADAVRLADPHRGQLTGLDEPVDGHSGDPQQVRDLGHREEPGPCVRLRQWYHPSPPVRNVRQRGRWGKRQTMGLEGAVMG